MRRKAIGIDPDSKGYICSLIDTAEGRVTQKSYLTTAEGMVRLISWVRSEGGGYCSY